MAFTREHDDPFKIQLQVEDSSFMGKYFLNTPGQGLALPFQEDPQIRLQKWGANLYTNPVLLENELFGMTRRLNRDDVERNDYQTAAAANGLQCMPIGASTAVPFVEESRATHPAWIYRDIEQPRWEHPWLNPIHGLEPNFPTLLQTRIIEKDSFETARMRK